MAAMMTATTVAQDQAMTAMKLPRTITTAVVQAAVMATTAEAAAVAIVTMAMTTTAVAETAAAVTVSLGGFLKNKWRRW
jgi:hypothetical protein